MLDRINAQADDFHVTLVKLGLDPSHIAEFGRAHRCKVLRVREQHDPRIANPIMEVNFSFCRLRFEVRGSITNLKSHDTPPLVAHPASGGAGWWQYIGNCRAASQLFREGL